MLETSRGCMMYLLYDVVCIAQKTQQQLRFHHGSRGSNCDISPSPPTSSQVDQGRSSYHPTWYLDGKDELLWLELATPQSLRGTYKLARCGKVITRHPNISMIDFKRQKNRVTVETMLWLAPDFRSCERPDPIPSHG